MSLIASLRSTKLKPMDNSNLDLKQQVN